MSERGPGQGFLGRLFGRKEENRRINLLPNRNNVIRAEARQQPRSLEELSQGFSIIWQEMSQDISEPKPESAVEGVPSEADAVREARHSQTLQLLETIVDRKIQEKKAFTEAEVEALADDLVRRGLESSIAQAKILNQTGKDTIQELIADREIIPKDLQGISADLEIDKKTLRDWMKKTGKKAAISTAIGVGLTILTGGSGVLLAAGLAGSTFGSGAVEFLRARQEKQYKQQEVKAIIDNILAAQTVAADLTEKTKESAPDQVAINEAMESFIVKVQENSQQALEARAKLFEKGHLRKWAWLSFGASVAGAAAGTGVWNALHGFLTIKTQAAAEALREAKTSGITTQQLAEQGIKDSTHDIGFRGLVLNVEGARETVRTTQGYFGYVINPTDIASETVKAGYPLTGVTSAGRLTSGAEAVGLVHLEDWGQHSIDTISKIGGIVNEWIGKEASQKAVRQFFTTLGAVAAGILSGEMARNIFHGEKKPYQKIKAGGERIQAGFEPTRQTLAQEKERLTKVQQEQKAEQEQAEAEKPKPGALYYAENISIPNYGSYQGRIELKQEEETGKFKILLLEDKTGRKEAQLTTQQVQGLFPGPYSNADRRVGFSEDGYNEAAEEKNDRYQRLFEKIGQYQSPYVIFMAKALESDILTLPGDLKELITQNPTAQIQIESKNYQRNQIVLRDKQGSLYQMNFAWFMSWVKDISQEPVDVFGTSPAQPPGPAEAAPTEQAKETVKKEAEEAKESPAAKLREPKTNDRWMKKDTSEYIVVQEIDERADGKYVVGYQPRNKQPISPMKLEDFYQDYQYVGKEVQSSSGGGRGRERQ